MSPGVRLRRFLLSRNLAIGVMVVMLTVLGLSSLVPEVDLAEPARAAEFAARKPLLAWATHHLKPQDIAASPFFLVLPAYLFAGISWSIVERTRQFRKASARGLEPNTTRFRVQRELELAEPPELAASRLVAEARRAGYDEVAASQDGWEGGRGRIGFAGSLAFHVGLLLVLAGVAASALTRLTGEVVLSEGFEVPLTRESMLTLSGSGNFPDLPGCTLAIRDLVADYSPQGTPMDYSLLLAVRRGKETLVERLVRVNGAFEWGGFQLTLHRFGYAPELTARDATGQERVSGVALLQLLPPGKEDAVPLAGGGELRLALFPDFALVAGRPVSRSPRAVNPALEFSWREADGREVARGRVGLGAETVVNGHLVAFSSLSNWGGFILARDRGLWFFVVGSLLGSLGMLLRLAYPDQSLKLQWAAVEGGTRVRIVAATRFFPALHEENLDRLLSRIHSAER